MNEELESLIEDAAKLLGLKPGIYTHDRGLLVARNGNAKDGFWFNPLDQERGDLMKVAEAAEIFINWKACWVAGPTGIAHDFTKGDYQSLAIAVLRAASAVYKSRGGVCDEVI